jgi:hypothetical protein
MIFGSVPMTFIGTTTKIHEFRHPRQTMFTKVFSSVSRPNAFLDSMPATPMVSSPSSSASLYGSPKSPAINIRGPYSPYITSKKRLEYALSPSVEIPHHSSSPQPLHPVGSLCSASFVSRLSKGHHPNTLLDATDASLFRPSSPQVVFSPTTNISSMTSTSTSSSVAIASSVPSRIEHSVALSHRLEIVLSRHVISFCFFPWHS